MKNLAIYGAGGLGRETALLIRQINARSPQWNILGYYDDAIAKGTIIDGSLVLGGLNDLNGLKVPLDLVVSISDPELRKKVVDGVMNVNIQFPSLMHPACEAGDGNNKFGKGCILSAGVILTTGIQLGDFVIVNLSSTLGHDVRIGEFSSVMPGCSISGNVKIGERTMIGTGARILQNLNIGAHCKVGAGAVVTRDIGDAKTVVGVPAYEK